MCSHELTAELSFAPVPDDVSPHQGFPDERAMHGPLRRIAHDLTSRTDATWVVAAEQPTVSRVPDLLAARIDLEALEARADSSLLRPLTASEIQIVQALGSHRWTRLSDIAYAAHITPPYARRILSKLTSQGFTLEGRHGYRRHRHIKPLMSRIVSYEAKLHDWRSALVQARAHQSFANETYVVFDQMFEHRFLRELESFKESRVGLVALSSQTGEYRRVSSSRLSPRDGHAVFLVGELLLGNLLGAPLRPLSETRFRGVLAPTLDPEPATIAGPRSKRTAQLLSAAALG